MTVRSGKCEPPAEGWFESIEEPSLKIPSNIFIWYCTDSCIAPRCTGMCGAFETNPPSGPKIAHEKSRRSFMFTDVDVLCKILKSFK